MRKPCPWCGRPFIAYERWDVWAKQLVREIEDHDCPAWQPVAGFNPPPITPSDPGRGEPGGKEAMAPFLEYVRSHQ